MHKKEVTSIEKIFQSNDFREALNQGSQPSRKYSRQEGAKIYKPERARFKLKIWFTDGNGKSFFSYDNRKKPDGSVFHDEWTGLKKLIKLIHKFDGKYKCAMIFATLDPDPLTAKSNYNLQVIKYTKTRQIQNEGVGFNTEGIMIYRRQAG